MCFDRIYTPLSFEIDLLAGINLEEYQIFMKKIH